MQPYVKKQPTEPKNSFQPGPVSLTMSERLFDGDLPAEKEMKSNILYVGDEWVVQSLTDMNEDIQTSFSEVGYKSLDLVEHTMVHVLDHTLETRLHLDNVQDDLVEDEDNVSLVWKRKGRRGVNEQEPTPTEIIAQPSLVSKDSQQQQGLRSGFLRKSQCQTKEKGK